MMPLAYGWEVGAGYTAGVVSRADIHNFPLPGALPMFTLGTRNTKLTLTYVPHLVGSFNGNVLYFNLRVAVK